MSMHGRHTASNAKRWIGYLATAACRHSQRSKRRILLNTWKFIDERYHTGYKGYLSSMLMKVVWYVFIQTLHLSVGEDGKTTSIVGVARQPEVIFKHKNTLSQ